jgi:uncharacterized protein (DUF1810 family)
MSPEDGFFSFYLRDTRLAFVQIVDEAGHVVEDATRGKPFELRREGEYSIHANGSMELVAERAGSVERFVSAIRGDAKMILRDLLNDEKEEHWIWWGLPVSIDTLSPLCSPTTLEFAITPEECIMFLSHSLLSRYYRDALTLLEGKSKGKVKGSLALKKYFSDIDFRKFKTHVVTFLDAISDAKKKKGGEGGDDEFIVDDEIERLLLYFQSILGI